MKTTKKTQPRKGWRELFRVDRSLPKKEEKVEYIPTKYDEEWVW